jgi:thiol-disulfide isomerase/thioredoxin
MKKIILHSLRCPAFLTLLWLLPQSLTQAATTINEDFSVVGQSVVRLLNTGDAAKFAEEVATSFADWQAVRSTNLIVNGEDPVAGFEKQAERTRTEIETSARKVLERASALGVDGKRVKYQLKEATSKFVRTTRYPSLQREGEELKWVPEVKVTLVGEAQGDNQAKLKGEYALSLGAQGGGLKFPAGWRFSGGIRWQSFPDGVLDDKTSLEMSLLNKVASDHKLRLGDDPALAETGKSLIKFLRAHDAKVFASEVTLSAEEIWAGFEKASASSGRPLPPRAEFDRSLEPRRRELLNSASNLLAQLEATGVVLSNASIELKDAVVENVYPRGGTGLENLDGGRVKFVFAVKSEEKTAAGRPLAGEYVIAAGHSQRQEKRWVLMDKVRWESIPETVLDPKAKAELQFENYVAERRALPPGTALPDVELVALDGEKKVKLADLKKEVMILEFWATWCGPCQEPMKKLQALPAKHPEWKDRVAIVTASIDDTIDLPRKHLEKRGWTNSVATWVGAGDWQAAATKSFRVSGVPTCYVIGKDGKVVASGHPESIQYEQVVERLLK